jgi:hypothetical protein
MVKHYDQAVSRVKELTTARDEREKIHTNDKGKLDVLRERFAAANSTYTDMLNQYTTAQNQAQAAWTALSQEKAKLVQAQTTHSMWQGKTAATQAELIQS